MWTLYVDSTNVEGTARAAAAFTSSAEDVELSMTTVTVRCHNDKQGITVNGNLCLGFFFGSDSFRNLVDLDQRAGPALRQLLAWGNSGRNVMTICVDGKEAVSWYGLSGNADCPMCGASVQRMHAKLACDPPANCHPAFSGSFICGPTDYSIGSLPVKVQQEHLPSPFHFWWGPCHALSHLVEDLYHNILLHLDGIRFLRWVSWVGIQVVGQFSG